MKQYTKPSLIMESLDITRDCMTSQSDYIPQTGEDQPLDGRTHRGTWGDLWSDR